MTTTADGQDLAKRLRAQACVWIVGDKASEAAAATCDEAAAFIERSCNTGQGVGEDVIADVVVPQLGGAPDDLRNLVKVVFAGLSLEQMGKVCAEVLARRDRSLAARIPEASVEQAGRSSAEPVAWPNWNDANDPWVRLFLGYDINEYLDGYEFRGDNGDYTPNEADLTLLHDAIAGVIGELHEKAKSLAPPAGRQGAVAVKALPEIIGYEVLGEGKMRTETWADAAQYHPVGAVTVDKRDVIIYRSRADGNIWVIPREEFEDSRFEALSSITPAAGEDATDA